MLTFDLNLAGINAAIDGIKTKAEQAIRPAAQAGAQVYYEAVKATAPKSKKGHWFHGTSHKINGTKYWFESGTLKSAVYQYFLQQDSSKTKAEYLVAWNHRKVPYGYMVANGTKRGAKANDYIGAARKTVQQRAVEAMLSTFNQRISQ